MSADAILEAILEALDRGEIPDAALLREFFPGQDATISRLLKATARYQHLMNRVRGGDAGEPGLRPGDRLGDFEIESFLGRGGMGSVWRARQLSLGGRVVALKVLPASVTDPEGRVRFQREALLLADLHHPSLAEVHGFGEERGLIYFAMRLVEGPTLQDVIGRCGAPATPADRRRCVAWMADVAGAVAEVHQAGLMHRDVKPSNIIIDERAGVAGGSPAGKVPSEPAEAWPEGRAVLVDFGLVRPVSSDSRTLTGIGLATLPYAASEQLLGRNVDARCDVFSLGVTLHDLLSGRLPRPVGRATARGQASTALSPLRVAAPGVDADLEAVVARSTDPDARWRYADGLALRDDLQAWLSGRPVSARRPKPVERLARWVRSHPERLLQALGAGCVLVLIVLLSGRWTRWERAGGVLRDAAARGDVATLSRAAFELPAWGLDVFVRDDGVERWVARVLAGTADDPVVQAARCLGERDPEGALLAATTALRVRGLSSEPLLQRMLQSAIAGSDERMRGIALSLTARLLYERESASPAEDMVLDALRAALAALPMGSLDLDGQFDAWTVMAGCGRMEDAALAIAEARDLYGAGQVDEAWRVRILCVERILRGAHAEGRLDAADVASTCEVAVPMLASVNAMAVRGDVPWKTREACDLLARSLVLACVEADVPIDPASCVRAGCQPVAVRDGAVHLDDGGDLRVAVGDPAPLDAVLGMCRQAGLPCGTPWRLGWSCGVMGDSNRIADCRAVVREADCGAFDLGVEAGRAARLGGAPQYLPDPDTLMGASTWQGGAWTPALTQGAWTAEDHGAWWHIEAGAIPLAPRHPGLLEYGLTEPEARWDFGLPAVTCTGTAREVSGQAVDVLDRNSGRPYLRLGQPGVSSVRLAFDVEHREVDVAWQIVISHQRSSRIYLPHKGEAPIEVSLDGKVVARVVTPTFMLSRHPVVVPPERLAPGRHEIAIRLARDATTTDWIHQVEVRRPILP